MLETSHAQDREGAPGVDVWRAVFWEMLTERLRERIWWRRCRLHWLGGERGCDYEQHVRHRLNLDDAASLKRAHDWWAQSLMLRWNSSEAALDFASNSLALSFVVYRSTAF